MTKLEKKRCIPCNIVRAALEPKEIDLMLSKLSAGWEINDSGHLCKSYLFPDFVTVIGFVNKIAEIAEHEGHHPNLTLAWGLCLVEIWTHKINGLTDSDFILAAKIDEIIK